MKLDLDRQELGTSEVEFREDVTLKIAGEPDTIVHLSGTLTVNNMDNRLVVTGSLNADLNATCDRCLEDFVQHFAVPLEILILQDTEDEEEPDSCVIHQKVGEVDLSTVLREAVLLALPLKRLCDENCQGLCIHCGCNRNGEQCQCQDEESDPRWDALPTGE
ncbi:MAG: DUF177 domain-containing protein [bacterium]